MGILGVLDKDELERQRLLDEAQARPLQMMSQPNGIRGMMANDNSRPVQLPATQPEWRPPMSTGLPDNWGPPMSLPEQRKPLGMPVGVGTAAAMAGPAVPSGEIPREQVPIPTLPGDEGGPRGYTPGGAARYDRMSKFVSKMPGYGSNDPIERARFENQIEGLKRDEQGQITDKYKGGFGQVLKNALLGFAQAAAANPQDALGAGLGGLAAGAIGSAVDRGGARNYAFDQTVAPQMRQQEARAAEREQQEFGREQREFGKKKQGVDLEGEQARVEQTKAQTKATLAGMKDADLAREKQKAEITLLKAREEAIRTGKPTYQDVLLEDGEIHKVGVYPDGSRVDLGVSGRAAMQTENISSRERVAGRREKGATARTKMTEVGKDRRLQTTEAGRDRRLPATVGSKLGGPKGMAPAATTKTVSSRAVREYLTEQQKKGQSITYEQALKRFQAKGINVVE